MLLLIPEWFFGAHSLVYIFCAMIGFLVSFYSYRSSIMTKARNHYYLYIAFASLSMGFLILGVTELYSYLSMSQGLMNMFEQFSSFRDFGIWLYYGCSLIAYFFLGLIYLPKDFKIMPLFLPFWYKGYPYFHVVSLFMMSFVIFRSTANWFVKRTTNSLLVFSSFLLIGFYHLFLFFTSFSEWMFVLAHISLMLGFLSLLAMVFRVSRKKGRF